MIKKVSSLANERWDETFAFYDIQIIFFYVAALVAAAVEAVIAAIIAAC